MKIYENKSVFGWEDDNGIGEMLIQQIVDGSKTATCSPKIGYTDPELEDLYSTKGKITTVLNKENEPKCNIKIIDIFETTFGNPDMRLVRGEGDGEDVQKFQNDHRIAWGEYMKELGHSLTDETVLIVELFELIEIID